MKIAVITSNQPRHISLVEKLSEVTTDLNVILESDRAYPGLVSNWDELSQIKIEHFKKGIRAEKKYFGDLRQLPKVAKYLVIGRGDLNFIDKNLFEEIVNSDLIVTYGCSIVKSHNFKILSKYRAINIHSGLLPYYRGSGSHFWAAFDESPEFIGSSVHLLSESLDEGQILFTKTPEYSGESFHEFSMKSLFEIQELLVSKIENFDFFEMYDSPSDNSLDDMIRISKNREFTDSVLADFNSRIDSVMRKLVK